MNGLGIRIELKMCMTASIYFYSCDDAYLNSDRLMLKLPDEFWIQIRFFRHCEGFEA